MVISLIGVQYDKALYQKGCTHESQQLWRFQLLHVEASVFVESYPWSWLSGSKDTCSSSLKAHGGFCLNLCLGPPSYAMEEGSCASFTSGQTFNLWQPCKLNVKINVGLVSPLIIPLGDSTFFSKKQGTCIVCGIYIFLVLFMSTYDPKTFKPRKNHLGIVGISTEYEDSLIL